jgi:stearoyl-CoA desaturase (delta-9 desaturase)
MVPSLVFFVIHWSVSIFCQTFFLHRYGAHRMFTMSKGWERFFHLLTAVSQGSSFLQPRGYAILHREHHAFSDTPRDPHSPHVYPGLGEMMWKTKIRYDGLNTGAIVCEPRFDGGYPVWPTVENIFNSWPSRIAWGTAYSVFYIVFAPHWAYYLLLPIHYIMGPIHGAIVNYCGHKFGYRNFETPHGDKSRNTLIFDFLTAGELFQNNHHARPMNPNFAARWFEIDPTYPIIRMLAALRIIELERTPSRKRTAEAAEVEEAVPAAASAAVSAASPIA